MILNIVDLLPALPQVTLVLLLLGASAFDLSHRRVPNLLTLSGAIAAVIFSLTGIAEISLSQALLGGIVGLALFIVPYAIGQMGAGDVKLLSMCGLYLGIMPVITAALYTMVAGGVLALFYLCRIRIGSVYSPKSTVPYAVAITAGVLFVLSGY